MLVMVCNLEGEAEKMDGWFDSGVRECESKEGVRVSLTMSKG